MVWIFVAIRALIERDADILRLAVRAVGVALRALHLYMQTSQRIAGFRVIEFADADRFPVIEVMAGLTVRTQAALMLVLVAGDASSRKAKISAVQVPNFDGAAFLRRNVRWIMALVAG